MSESRPVALARRRRPRPRQALELPRAVLLAHGRAREAPARRPVRPSKFRRQPDALAPGAQSALRHAHTVQDEFVYILEGRADAGHRRRAHAARARHVRRLQGRHRRRPSSRQRDRSRRRLSRNRRPRAGRRRDLSRRRHRGAPRSTAAGASPTRTEPRIERRSQAPGTRPRHIRRRHPRRRGRELPHAQVLRNLVEQAVLADRLGVDFIGVGEHHRADFAVCAPEVLLAAIATRTTRIRLGSAVTVLSSDDPIRVYQRFSTLDARVQRPRRGHRRPRLLHRIVPAVRLRPRRSTRSCSSRSSTCSSRCCARRRSTGAAACARRWPISASFRGPRAARSRPGSASAAARNRWCARRATGCR